MFKDKTHVELRNEVSTPKGCGFDFPLEGDLVLVLVRRDRARARKRI